MEGKNNFAKLPSDLHMHAMAHTCVHTHNKHLKKKEKNMTYSQNTKHPETSDRVSWITGLPTTGQTWAGCVLLQAAIPCVISIISFLVTAVALQHPFLPLSLSSRMERKDPVSSPTVLAPLGACLLQYSLAILYHQNQCFFSK